MESNEFVETSKRLQAAMMKKSRIEKRIEKLANESAGKSDGDIRAEIIAKMEKSIEKKIVQYRERQQKKVTVEQNKLLELSKEIKKLAGEIQGAIE